MGWWRIRRKDTGAEPETDHKVEPEFRVVRSECTASTLVEKELECTYGRDVSSRWHPLVYAHRRGLLNDDGAFLFEAYPTEEVNFLLLKENGSSDIYLRDAARLLVEAAMRCHDLRAAEYVAYESWAEYESTFKAHSMILVKAHLVKVALVCSTIPHVSFRVYQRSVRDGSEAWTEVEGIPQT
jgi:hypothetical protein